MIINDFNKNQKEGTDSCCLNNHAQESPLCEGGLRKDLSGVRQASTWESKGEHSSSHARSGLLLGQL